MSETDNKGRSGTKRPWFGARPIFLVAVGLALLAFGIIFGAALDLATRPPKPQAAPVPVIPHPSRQYVAPRIEIPPGVGTPAGSPPEATSIFARGTQDPGAQGEVNAKPAPAGRAMAAHTVPATASARQAVVAVVIDDLGLDRPRGLKIIELPGPLTLSLMTYAEGLPGLAELAHKGGHEVMAHVPMEPVDPQENPGPGALKVNMDDATIRRLLAAGLDGWSGYVGINNHMGSKFTKDGARMAVVMDELKARGLLWLDSKTTGDSSGPAAARTAGVPFLERDVFLDNTETVEAVNAQLAQLVALAKTHGTAVGIGHPHDSTLAALRKWLPTLAGQGVALVPVTEILKRRNAPAKLPPG